MARHTLLIAFAAATLTGCSLAPNYTRPAMELPTDWQVEQGQPGPGIGVKWWTFYGDAKLNVLIEEALQHNADLALALARVDEARALLGESRSRQFPTLDAGVEASRTRASLRTAIPIPPGTQRTNNDYRATLNTAYELDLWGRLSDASAAARAELLATQAASETVRLVLLTDVIKGYYALRALDEQLAATRRSLATRRESLELQRLQFKRGVISKFAFRKLEAEVEAARAQLPVLELRRSQQETALTVLLGRSPKAIYTGKVAVKTLANTETTGMPPALVVPAGLPSALLLRRPDLVEAEQHLIAANARIGVARAAYFPSITLTGFLGSESTELTNLFTGTAGISQVAVALTQPIWNAGRINAQVDAAHAREQQALLQYQQTIRNAFRDVRDAIVGQIKAREQFDAETRRVVALRDSLRLARLYYQNGIASQLDVLDAERNLLAAELSSSDALRVQRDAVADLFKALGGGWRQQDEMAARAMTGN